jgi:hypothetical protein
MSGTGVGESTNRDSHAIAESFIANQTRELEVRQRELDTRTQELSLNHEQSMKAMDLHAQDRRETREMMLKGHEKNLRWHLWLGALSIFGILGLVYMGQAILAGDLAKIGGGLIAGYLAGKAKSKSNERADTE